MGEEARGLSAAAPLVGGIGIANVMVIGVLERRSEIGLRRVLGATKRHVRAQFLTEALIMCAIGWIAGAALGAVVTMAFARAQEAALVFPPIGIASGLGTALRNGPVAGLDSAIRPARLSLTDALGSA